MSKITSREDMCDKLWNLAHNQLLCLANGTLTDPVAARDEYLKGAQRIISDFYPDVDFAQYMMW
jgi:hypothetical protein